jgi:hypothetical protein
MPTTSTTTVEAKGGQLTLGEVLAALQEHLKANPEAASLPVFHVEFGGITRSLSLTIDGKMAVIE